MRAAEDGLNYAELKEEAWAANMELHRRGLVLYTWGNVSQLDRERSVFAIKPSGMPYERLTADDMVVVDLDGQSVEGKLRPSSDTKTHAHLYRQFDGIGGRFGRRRDETYRVSARRMPTTPMARSPARQ